MLIADEGVVFLEFLLVWVKHTRRRIEGCDADGADAVEEASGVVGLVRAGKGVVVGGVGPQVCV